MVCHAASGQLLAGAGYVQEVRANGGKWLPRGAAVVAAVLVLHGLTTLAWIWVLQRSEHGKISTHGAGIRVGSTGHFFVLEESFTLGCALLVILTSSS